MAEWVITVSQLNEYVRKKLSGDALLQSLSVKGEISDLKAHYASGHLYFTLKDDKARIACVMYRSNAQALKTELKNGMKVVVFGQAGIYPVSGQYQLYVESLKQEGLGSIYERFEELKRKLGEEGLFETAHKKRIPTCVSTVGVATSGSGAAVRDIIRVARYRNPHVNIIVSPCRVQGAGAEYEIADAIRLLDRCGKCDVILVGRGGGSIEDLWPFNEEVTARAVFNCNTPVISCVGHETDFTICDFVADLRAATPSNGAELAVADVKKQIQQLNTIAKRMDSSIKNAQIQRHMRLDMLMCSPVFTSPREKLIEKRAEKLGKLFDRLKSAQSERITDLRTSLDNSRRILDSLNPDNIKKRGYACVRRNGKLVTAVKDISLSDKITVELYDGKAEATVDAIME